MPKKTRKKKELGWNEAALIVFKKIKDILDELREYDLRGR